MDVEGVVDVEGVEMRGSGVSAASRYARMAMSTSLGLGECAPRMVRRRKGGTGQQRRMVVVAG